MISERHNGDYVKYSDDSFIECILLFDTVRERWFQDLYNHITEVTQEVEEVQHRFTAKHT